MGALKIHNPPGVASPSAAYSQGMEAPPNARWLHISGQVAVDLSGNVPEGIEAQADLVFHNLSAVLASAGMDTGDLVKITMYLTRVEDVPVFRAIRDRFLGSARPASTLVVVQALVRPEWIVEVEAVAAKA
jgi:2-iminobutanoate/2-iminopropanoate deaminase